MLMSANRLRYSVGVPWDRMEVGRVDRRDPDHHRHRGHVSGL